MLVTNMLEEDMNEWYREEMSWHHRIAAIFSFFTFTFVFQVFLQFAKHQVEDQHEESSDEKEALKQKKHSMRQVSMSDQNQDYATPLWTNVYIQITA